MKKLSNKKRIFIITLILFTISLLSTIVLYLTVNKDKVDYKKIECVVSKVTKTKIYNKKNRRIRYNYSVIVLYKNKSYKLINVYDSNIHNYNEGAIVEAYLNNNKLYANEAGVKTSTATAKLYFVFLFVTIGMFVICLITGTNYKKEKNIDIQIKNQLKN